MFWSILAPVRISEELNRKEELGCAVMIPDKDCSSIGSHYGELRLMHKINKKKKKEG